jgi:hypothetical protein
VKSLPSTSIEDLLILYPLFHRGETGGDLMLLIKPEHYRKVLKQLWAYRDMILKQIGARSGKAGNAVWNLISNKKRRKPLDEQTFKETLPALGARPAHAAWIETLEELAGHESEEAASRGPDEAADWGRLAAEAAERVKGPDWAG